MHTFSRFEETGVRVKRAHKARSELRPKAGSVFERVSEGRGRAVKTGPLKLALAEDNRADALLTKAALSESAVPARVTCEFSNGTNLVSHLGDLIRNRSDMPDAVLLDLGLPGANGFEILAEFEADPFLRGMPIIVITGFNHFDYLKKAYSGLNVISFLTKPCGVSDLEEALTQVTVQKKRRA